MAVLMAAPIAHADCGRVIAIHVDAVAFGQPGTADGGAAVSAHPIFLSEDWGSSVLDLSESHASRDAVELLIRQITLLISIPITTDNVSCRCIYLC
jgi:hypothetical protein